MLKRLIISILSVFLILSAAAAIIFYGRGYRYDSTKQKVTPTGILSVSSYPEKASIFVNGKLTSATNASLSLPPGWYQIKISKDGYQSWEKQIRVQGEVVSQIDALLIPQNPSLKALTTTGVVSPILSDSSTKVAYFVTNAQTNQVTLKSKNGLYILELRSGALGGQPVPKQVFIADRSYNFDQAQIYWSNDEKEIILKFPDLAFLTSVEDSNQTPVDVTYRLEEILYEATGSANLSTLINPPIIGSNPTEEIRKIEPDKYYLYDIKEDKNYFIGKLNTPRTSNIEPVWYTDSKHLVVVDKDRINIVDYDGTNKRSVYSGPFQGQIVLPWSPGGKIVILTNLN